MKILFVSILASIAVAVTSCGSNEGNESNQGMVEDGVTTELVELDFNDPKLTKAQKDSLTNHPDEMTADEAASALVYLYQSVEQSSGAKRLVAVRKFMDFYNIVLDNHGDDLRSSLAKVKKKQDIDIAKIYEIYAPSMSSGDEGGATIDDVKVDTIRTVTGDATTVTTVVSEGPVVSTSAE